MDWIKPLIKYASSSSECSARTSTSTAHLLCTAVHLSPQSFYMLLLNIRSTTLRYQLWQLHICSKPIRIAVLLLPSYPVLCTNQSLLYTYSKMCILPRHGEIQVTGGLKDRTLLAAAAAACCRVDAATHR